MKLKVCGMREPDNIEALSGLKPDYMGFIFWAQSKRFVEKETPQIPAEIKKTGVFVDATVDYIQSCIETHHLNAIQLHGKETPQYCALVKSFGKEIIKAFSVATDFDFKTLEAYENSCDYFLFDTKGELPGGNGFGFDWSILKNYPYTKPFFLSGGIGPNDIPKLKKILKTDLPIHAIDVNSKFESQPGKKEIPSLSQFKKDMYEL